jgi:hypothetical protein
MSCADLEGVGFPVAEFAKSVAVEVELEVEEVELVTFATPITALIFVPSPLLQHVLLAPPQHQLPSVH